jgi:hypothetical protein
MLAQGLIFDSNREIIDSTLFYDDGNHRDGMAGDGLWGTSWRTSQDEQHYSFKTKLTDLASGITRNDYNITRFTTIGPVILDRYVNLSSDTLVNPGAVLPIRLILKNESLTATASNIYIGGGMLDTVVTDVSTSDNRFADIPPGSTVTSSGIFVIRFANNFEGDRDITFWVDIYSDNYLFWRDTFSVYIYPTHISSHENSKIPEDFSLSQNYPNPFNPKTTIRYQLPAFSRQVDLSIFNMRGQKIATLVSGEQSAGTYTIDWNARGFPSGIYFYKLQTDSFTEQKKMILLR